MGHVHRLKPSAPSSDTPPLVCRRAPRTRLCWRERVRHEVYQNPLMETRVSLDGLESCTRVRPPGAVLVGLGLCRKRRVSRGIPADLLGLLLPAECVRRAVSASRLVVLIADEHAIRSGVPEQAVQAQVLRLNAVVKGLARHLGLTQLQLVHASEVHRDYAYRILLRQVNALAHGVDNGYVRRQIADVEYADRLFGGVLKVGWTIGSALHTDRFSDEVAFDRRFRAILGDHVPFAYCKAGRTIDDRRLKASPYVVANPATRVLLKQDEDLTAKLASVHPEASDDAINGVYNHIKAITREYERVSGRPMRGRVQQRFATMVAEVLGQYGPRRNSLAI